MEQTKNPLINNQIIYIDVCISFYTFHENIQPTISTMLMNNINHIETYLNLSRSRFINQTKDGKAFLPQIRYQSWGLRRRNPSFLSIFFFGLSSSLLPLFFPCISRTSQLFYFFTSISCSLAASLVPSLFRSFFSLFLLSFQILPSSSVFFCWFLLDFSPFLS